MQISSFLRQNKKLKRRPYVKLSSAVRVFFFLFSNGNLCLFQPNGEFLELQSWTEKRRTAFKEEISESSKPTYQLTESNPEIN